MKKIPELLAPAGTLDAFKTAVLYGADAIYAGLPGFSMRARAKIDVEAKRIMKEEVNAVRFALDHWQNLGCEGLAIRIQPERTIGAIAIWEELNASTALVHFEKGFVRYKGIYKIINQETAKTLRDRYTWINREFDMDVPGLREAKLRYHPEHCAKAWYIKKKEITP